MKLTDGQMYTRKELVQEIGEDVSALTDEELAAHASEKSGMKVSFLPKFFPPFLCEKSRQRRRL